MQPMYPTYESRAKAKIISTILTVVVIAGVVLVVDHLKAERLQAISAQQQVPTTSQVSVAPTTTTTPSTPTSSSATTTTSPYKDGIFTASSDYYVPGSNQSIRVTLTVKDGTITASSISNSEGDPTSAAYQQDFASSYKSYVVGKRISTLRLGVIAGASDTSKGFEAAVRQISSQVQA